MSVSFQERAAWLRAFAIGIALVASSGCAGFTSPFTPLQLGIAPGAQIFAKETPVRGLRASFYGVQEEVMGVDFGFVNDVEKAFAGIGIGVANIAHGTAFGIHMAAGNVYEGDFTGIQGIGVNQVAGDMTGLQFGVINYVEKTSRSAQLSIFFNRAGDMKGVQVGIVNVAESLKGVQFGLLNLNSEGWLPLVPFINIGW